MYRTGGRSPQTRDTLHQRSPCRWQESAWPTQSAACNRTQARDGSSDVIPKGLTRSTRKSAAAVAEGWDWTVFGFLPASDDWLPEKSRSAWVPGIQDAWPRSQTSNPVGDVTRCGTRLGKPYLEKSDCVLFVLVDLFHFSLPRQDSRF